ncbi:MAG: type IV pilin protein [Pseudomonadales bacterium]|nr:type IV pilin protein [Pseudomonadales bacterium]
MQRPPQEGFTLIEMMVVVAVMAILAAIAMPSYQEYLLRAHRADGIALLNEVAARQERHYAQNNRYVIADDDVAELSLRNAGVSDSGYYQLSLAEGGDDDGGYVLTAIALDGQAADTDCLNLILSGAGERGVTGTAGAADCWR